MHNQFGEQWMKSGISDFCSKQVCDFVRIVKCPALTYSKVCLCVRELVDVDRSARVGIGICGICAK